MWDAVIPGVTEDPHLIGIWIRREYYDENRTTKKERPPSQGEGCGIQVAVIEKAVKLLCKVDFNEASF